MTRDILKNIIIAMLGVIVPILFSIFTQKYPGFPLDQDQILSLFVWAVGMLFTGANIAYLHAKVVSSKYRYDRHRFFKP